MNRIQKISLAIFLLFSGITLGVSYYSLHKLIGRPDFSGDWYQKEFKKGNDRIKAREHQPVAFTSSDGYQLHGLLFNHDNPRGAVILCHGFQRSKEYAAKFLDLFSDYAVLLFDFRLSGKSAGDYSSIGCHEYRDVVAAAQFIQNTDLLSAQAKKPIIMLGVSMGASSIIKALALHPGIADALILDSAYACLDDEIAHIFSHASGLPYYPFFPVMKRMFHWYHGDESYRMQPVSYIKVLREPLLLIHSSTDVFTLPEHSIRLYAAAFENEKAELWIGPPAKHGRLYDQYPDLYRKKVYKFLHEYNVH